MNNYDYENAKVRINEILNSKTDIERNIKEIPKDESAFTYDNGIKTWVGAIFVDIVKSTSLFKDNNEEKIARMMRAFCQEIITIFSKNSNFRQIGIRGDCVYAIYNCSNIANINSIYEDAATVNTFHNMFQKLLKKNGFPSFDIGIGIGASETLVIKAGKKGTGISDNIWIGDAVIDASKLSSEAGREGRGKIMISGTFHFNLDKYFKENSETNYFERVYSQKLETYVYQASVIWIAMNNWVETL